ncbi:unnamed protein product [Rhizophagus irregularis]|nr:unnamed protein product [Rhizophagus irregularis]
MTCYKVKTEVDQVDHVSGIHNDPTLYYATCGLHRLNDDELRDLSKIYYIQPFRIILRTSSRRIDTIEMKSKDKDQDEDEKEVVVATIVILM